MTRQVPEKMRTAFRVVSVKWLFLLRTRPVASWAIWGPLRPSVHRGGQRAFGEAGP